MESRREKNVILAAAEGRREQETACDAGAKALYIGRS